jgi:hypothetical protein
VALDLDRLLSLSSFGRAVFGFFLQKSKGG